MIASLTGIVVAAAGLLWGCGLLVARPLLPQRYLPLLPLIAPFLGFSLISAVAHYAGSALRDVLWLFVVLAAAGWVLTLLDRRLRRWPRSSAPVLAICLLAFAFAIGPLLSLGYLTTVGGTIDGVSYAVRSEYLQTAPLSPLPELEPGKPYLGWVRLQLGLLRAGDVYLVGLLGLLTGKRSHELLTIVPALFFALTAGSAYVLARGALGFRRAAGVLAAGLVAANNLLLWPVYDNFVSQAVALAFLPVVMAFGILGIAGARRPDWRMAALFAVLFSGLLSVYPAFALIALAAVLLAWGLAWLGRPNGRALGRAALWWLGALCLTFLWNGVALMRTAAELGLVSGALTSGARDLGGNIEVFPTPLEAFGLVSHAAASQGSRWERVPAPVLNALGLLFAAVACYGWWRLKPRARLAAAALLVTSGLLMAQQRWMVPFPYGYFKAVTTAAPLVMLLVACGLASLWRARRPGSRWLAMSAALLLFAVNLKHGLWSQALVLHHGVLLDRELIGIGRAASAVEPDAWVLLDMKESLRQHWLGYLIRDRKIRFRKPLWFGNIDDPAAANAFFRYAVVEREIDELRRRTAPDEPWYDPASHARRWGNDRFELRERRDPLLASVHWDRRWAGQDDLVLALDPSLSVRVGPEVREGGIGPGLPRTIQVRLYSLSPDSRVEVAALGAPVTLEPGGWLLDVDLGCIKDRRIAIGRSSGDILLADIRVLSAVTGTPGACLETSPLSTGAAYLEQDDLGSGRIRFRAAVLRPEGDGRQPPYRLGLHVFDLSQGNIFGVWGLDFPPGPRVQQGSLEIDLRDRSSRGEIGGLPVGIELTNAEQDTGSFEAQAVWWQFTNPVERLGLQRVLWFQRQPDGAVQVIKTIPAAPLQVLLD
ncbi:MAG: hypothetical protein QOH06_2300 [Acidobacteriota bacterium]|nr:hypothetical protein [Acidobacteriota bacterium]